MLSTRILTAAFAIFVLALTFTPATAQDQPAAKPCSSAEYRQFDFWIGEWEVQNPDGQVVGRNVIRERLDGCLLTEEWESVAGGKGFSINYYDNEAGTWTQTYRDNRGRIALWPDLVGGIRDGAMVLESVPGAQPMSRWVWTPMSDDKVRQMAETSQDGGKTWQVVWDSYYIRKD